MKRRELITAAALVPMVGAAPALAQAQAGALPSTVKYVVPFAARGLTDVMARMASKQLAESLGVNFVVDNRAGGNGQIGAELVAKGPADGSQLLAITLAHAANVTLLPHSNFDFRKDLQPVALLAGVPMLVVVPTDSPIQSFADLVKVAKVKTLNAGSSGNGTPPHLTMALFAQANASPFNHIPYRGGAPSMTDLIGGRLDVIFSNFPESIAHVLGGSVARFGVVFVCAPSAVVQRAHHRRGGHAGLARGELDRCHGPYGNPTGPEGPLCTRTGEIHVYARGGRAGQNHGVPAQAHGVVGVW